MTGMLIEGVTWKREEAVDREDKAKFFFLMRRKECCVRKGKGRGRGGEVEGERMGGV